MYDKYVQIKSAKIVVMNLVIHRIFFFPFSYLCLREINDP